MRGVDLGHHGGDCSVETILHRHDLTDPVLWRIAEIVHEADIDDERFDAPEAPGLDASTSTTAVKHFSAANRPDPLIAECVSPETDSGIRWSQFRPPVQRRASGTANESSPNPRRVSTSFSYWKRL
ncbi:chromate resistance protein ChrB domain-containing protein [Nocardia sp. NPDC002869]|uniref:chromate resistance protein ChrB domain-containing protein n=1 Tax=Nocardia sp. NPDC002869 TaxID=3161032 RepID=UPI00398D4278